MDSSGTGSGQSPSSAPQGAAAADGDGAGGEKLVFEAPPQPVRKDYVQNAVKFLSHPKVRGSHVVDRRSFLEKKGLTTQEIDEAFRRVPDPRPSTTATASPAQQASNQNQSTGVQTYAPVQPVQPATGPVTAGPVVLRQQRRFSWYQAFLAAGLLLGFGASAAVFVKKLFLPRLKSWIRKVVAEDNETEGTQPKAKIHEETAEAVKASASAVSAIAKTNQELLASKDEEKKILVNLTQALDSQAKQLKSLSESLTHSRESINITREDRFSQYRPLEEHAAPAIRNGPVNSSWRTPQQTNMYGVPNSDFSSAGRPSYAPTPTEPASGSFSRSYAEQTMSTAQQGNRSSGSKPWEMQHYPQQRPGYGSYSQLSDDGSYSEAQDNYAPSYHQNGKAPDVQADEPRPLAYNAGVEERPLPQRRWVPPQTPAVAMPEAAAAIRQPKTLSKQTSNDATEATGELQLNGASSASAVVTEVPVNGSTPSDAGRSEIEEQSEAI